MQCDDGIDVDEPSTTLLENLSRRNAGSNGVVVAYVLQAQVLVRRNGAAECHGAQYWDGVARRHRPHAPRSLTSATRSAKRKDRHMASRQDRGGIAGISTGGIIVIVGIIIMIVWSLWIGLIVTLVGLIAFGGFARGKWY